MSLPNEVNLHHLGSTGYIVNQSLRFRASASAYLSRTGSTATNAQKATYSFWFKRGALTTGQWLFTGGTTTSLVGFNGSSDLLSVLGSDTTGEGNITTAVFRDPSAWYHIVIAIDTTQATASDRAKIYINGTQQAVSTSAGGLVLNSSWGFNTAGTLNIGRYGPSPGSYSDGYMAEANFIDGQALTPSSFGETDSQTGVWKPKKYSGTYGTNGFYLNFSDNSGVTSTTLGKDSSGNSNNWTPNNFSVTAGTTYDWMRDSPSLGALASNHCTINPISNNCGPLFTISNGNLTYACSASSGNAGRMAVLGSMGMKTGSFYWEIKPTGTTNAEVGIGASLGSDTSTPNATGTVHNQFYSGGAESYGTTATYSGTTPSYSAGDTLGLAFNATAGTLGFYVNNTYFGGFTGIDTTKTWMPIFTASTGGQNTNFTVNFGQQPFTYTPPSGYKALNTYNLPDPTIGATSATQANKYFDIGLYTGNGSATSRAISGPNTPDFVWIKGRSGSAASHALYDAIRGFGKRLYSNIANSESDYGTAQLAPTTTGFNLTTSDADHNTNGSNYVSWQWNAGNSTVTNTAGSITSQVRANPSVGFSIVTYTGNNTAGATAGHGLGVAPSVMFIKQYNAADSWNCYHVSLGNTKAIFLNQDAGPTTASSFWNNTTPSSTVITFGNAGTNQNNNVAYCWTPIAGYSAFGSYIGNSSSDGPYVYTGFRPRFILVKGTSGSRNWYIWDTARNTYNVMNFSLYPNSSTTEITASDLTFDSLANGFKARGTSIGINNSGEEYLYMAFAETPFKYALAR
jgi:hypothetical protein